MQLSQAVELFNSDMAHRSANTARAYDLAVRQLMSQVGDMPVENLTGDHLLAAIRQANVRNVSVNTLAAYTTGLAVFAKFLILERLATFDMADLARFHERAGSLRGRHPRRLPQVPTADAVEALLAAVKSAPARTSLQRLMNARDQALLMALISTGARVGEIVGLRRADLIAAERAAIVTGKGDHERKVFFGTSAWKALEDYLDLRADSCGLDAPVFARHNTVTAGYALPMTTTSVRNVVNRYAVEAGISYLHPHMLRHWVATRVLAATGDLAVTQDILGHASPTTTRLYTKLVDSRLRAAHDAANL